MSRAALPILLPALGALLVLAVDLLGRTRPVDAAAAHRATALSGIRLAAVALLTLGAMGLSLRGAAPVAVGSVLAVDAFATLAILFLVGWAFLVLCLSLTHFGMARSRPAEPLALLLFSLAGLAAATATRDLLTLLVALELAWLPLVALIAIDSRRLSSSESSLKAFFAHGLASLVLAQGLAFVFGATGRLELDALSQAPGQPLLLDVGVALLIAGLLARAVVAPFHPWSPDVHEGAPSFVTTWIATGVQATSFFVLLRLLHALVPAADGDGAVRVVARLPELLGVLGVVGLVWGHAMALVQIGLRRMVGWLGVGQAGFFTLALVEARGAGGEALFFALAAAGIAVAGVLGTLASLSHHERACENVGDLAGMAQQSPIRAVFFALFLLSLAGFPGTMGFVARLRILSALDQGGHRGLLLAGLAATVLALIAAGRPLLAMLRPPELGRPTSRALSHEQLVLALCGACILYLGLAPLGEVGNVASWLDARIDLAVAGLRD